jgi:hypothetical protein
MDEHIYNYRFKVTQHSVENIKIVENSNFVELEVKLQEMEESQCV